MPLSKEEKRKKARKFLRVFSTRSDWFVLDTETTGPEPDEDEIVEVSVLDAEGREVLGTLVNPTCEISSGAEQVHGIGESDVFGAPTMDALYPTLGTILRTETVLIYNRAFDGPVMENAFRARGIEVDWEDWDLRCVMEAYAMGFGEWDDYHGSYSWVKLETACKQRNVSFEDTTLHRAKGDAELTRRLVRSFAEKPEPTAEP